MHHVQLCRRAVSHHRDPWFSQLAFAAAPNFPKVSIASLPNFHAKLGASARPQEIAALLVSGHSHQLSVEVSVVGLSWGFTRHCCQYRVGARSQQSRPVVSREEPGLLGEQAVEGPGINESDADHFPCWCQSATLQVRFAHLSDVACQGRQRSSAICRSALVSPAHRF